MKRETAAALVGTMLLIVLGATFVSAILRYPTPDDALKIISGFSALVGVVTGAFVSYFFTRSTQDTLRTVQGAAETARRTADSALRQAAHATAGRDAFHALRAEIEPDRMQQIADRNPVVARALRPPTSQEDGS